MNKLTADKVKWGKKYFGGMVGLTIMDVRMDVDEYGEVWPILIAQDKQGDKYTLEVSQDPEGNGPGFIFGLPEAVVR
jgi:hypothetical protein